MHLSGRNRDNLLSDLPYFWCINNMSESEAVVVFVEKLMVSRLCRPLLAYRAFGMGNTYCSAISDPLKRSVKDDP